MPRRTKPPAATVALFVRHGVTGTTGKVLPGRARGLHLADAGRAQADAVAERLAGLKKVDAVYSSPLERTRETAAAIGRRLGLKVATERGLLECDFGEWTGAELKALVKLPEWRTVQRYPSGFRFPKGESFKEMQTRITDTVARIRARHPGQTVVLVSHADPIKAAVADAAGTPLDLFQRLVISPCSVTAIAYGNGGPMVLSFNSLGDLSELRAS
ncbi:MAG: MSMEG_4193 family putative phosphomutase [Acidimicrobiales bacterium]